MNANNHSVILTSRCRLSCFVLLLTCTAVVQQCQAQLDAGTAIDSLLVLPDEQVLALATAATQQDPAAELTSSNSSSSTLVTGAEPDAVRSRQQFPPKAQNTAEPPPYFYAALLNGTNTYRARHHAQALQWSSALAADAARWADACTFRPDANVNGGENIYATSSVAGLSTAMDNAVKLWYQQVSKYDFNKPGHSLDTGAFTQLVWRETTEMGCAARLCKNGIKATTFKQGSVVVCRYLPQGNFPAANRFEQNVLPVNLKPMATGQQQQQAQQQQQQQPASKKQQGAPAQQQQQQQHQAVINRMQLQQQANSVRAAAPTPAAAAATAARPPAAAQQSSNAVKSGGTKIVAAAAGVGMEQTQAAAAAARSAPAAAAGPAAPSLFPMSWLSAPTANAQQQTYTPPLAAPAYTAAVTLDAQQQTAMMQQQQQSFVQPQGMPSTALPLAAAAAAMPNLYTPQLLPFLQQQLQQAYLQQQQSAYIQQLQQQVAILQQQQQQQQPVFGSNSGFAGMPMYALPVSAFAGQQQQQQQQGVGSWGTKAAAAPQTSAGGMHVGVVAPAVPVQLPQSQLLGPGATNPVVTNPEMTNPGVTYTEMTNPPGAIKPGMSTPDIKSPPASVTKPYAQTAASPQSNGSSSNSGSSGINTKTSSSSSVTSTGSSSSGGGPPSDRALAYALSLHNMHRKDHLANPLMWHELLSKGAADQVAGCKFKLEPSKVFSENIFVSLSQNRTQAVADAMAFWYGTSKNYDYSNPRFQETSYPFTQIVWRSTFAVGCAAQTCSSGIVGTLVLCRYAPPGNTGTASTYLANVKPFEAPKLLPAASAANGWL